MSKLSKTMSGATAASGGPVGKNLILCLDGTSNTFSQNLTNLPILYSLLETDPEKQRCYYQTGIGTYESVFSPSALVRRAYKLLDEAVAIDLASHVQDAYEFLMDTYEPGDQIYLFGFSRGAYTARALAGFLQQVGLLLPHNKESIPLAYSIYKRKASTPFVTETNSLPGITLAAAFKRDFSRTVCVHFIGVWDTVSSVGAIIPRTLPFASGNTHIRHFRHALSLDERRARFSYQPWIKPDVDQVGAPGHQDVDSRTGALLPNHESDVQEVWFPGSHSDVGGGATATDDGRGPRLSNISLRWIIREAMDKGLLLDEKRVLNNNLFSRIVTPVTTRLNNNDKQIAAYLVNSTADMTNQSRLMVAVIEVATREPSFGDELAPRHDALGIVQGLKFKYLKARVQHTLMGGFWWTLEFLPTLKFVWDAAGSVKKWSCWPNFGRGRELYKSPLMHKSVETRMRAPAASFGAGDGQSVRERKYVPKARFQKNDRWDTVTYVE